VKHLVDVIKPKQTALLMITCMISFIIASKGFQFSLKRFLLTTISTFLAVSGTTALNMWLDRDIDALMHRTRNRPVPSGKLSPWACMVYGSSLFSIGFYLGLLVKFLLSIVLLLGLIFDIVIYTVLLKRRSPYSIVLGGFAGAMPALAGWCAVRDDILGGLIISSIILLWIPAHIWYITMHYEDDYKRAKIPMYPLIVGMERASWTIVILISLMLIAVTLLYLFIDLNFFYLIVSSLTVTYFLYRAIRFAKCPDRIKAKNMYKLASLTLGIVYISMLFGLW